MNVLPSTSSIRAPEARRMNSGEASTALNARTGLSTPPGRICWARAKSFDERVVFMTAISRVGTAAESADGPSGVAGVVGDDDVGPGAADRGQRFEHRARLVDPAVARGRLQHR